MSFDRLDQIVLELLNLAPKGRPRYFARIAARQRATRMDGRLTIEKALRALDRIPEFKMPSQIYGSTIWHQMEKGPSSLKLHHELISRELAQIGLRRVSSQEMSSHLAYQPPLSTMQKMFSGGWNTPEWLCYFGVRDICSDNRLTDVQRLLVISLLYQEAILLRATDRILTLQPLAKSVMESFAVSLGSSEQMFKDLFQKKILDLITSTHHWKCDLSPSALPGSLYPILTSTVMQSLKKTQDRKRLDFEKVRSLLSQNKEIPRDNRDLQYAYQQYMKEFGSARRVSKTAFSSHAR